MEQPPILGRPRWPGSPPEPPDGGGETRAAPQPPPADPAAPHQPSPASPPAGQRDLRMTVLATAGVASVVLVVCNGLLLWLYQHSSLGVVVTLATFVTAGALAWLRNRGRQLTMIVLYVQALVAVSAAVGILVGLNAGFFSGVFAAGVTFAGLLLLSLTGLLYYTGERGKVATMVSAGSALAVLASMIGAYAFLSWDYYENAYVPPYIAPPEWSVDFLIETGQYYTGHPADDPEVVASFERYTCPSAREDIATLFAELVQRGQQRLATPEDVAATERGRQGDTETATVTATVSVIDDFDETVIEGPETWTFRLEKQPGDQYWRVCRIERPA